MINSIELLDMCEVDEYDEVKLLKFHNVLRHIQTYNMKLEKDISMRPHMVITGKTLIHPRLCVHKAGPNTTEWIITGAALKILLNLIKKGNIL